MATVTKAKTLKSNKALTLNIAGGKPCDAEMVRQPTHARAITRQRWQVRNGECGSNSLRLMSSRKDIRPPSQKKHQSPQERTESPKTGREEKTRKMIREAKIITRPSLPAPVPGKPNLSHLLITLSRTQCQCLHYLHCGPSSSHLVGCHTTFNGDMHVDYSTIYIPCGHGHPWAGPAEWCFFLARCCLGQVPGGAPFSQRSEQATACTNRMQIRN